MGLFDWFGARKQARAPGGIAPRAEFLTMDLNDPRVADFLRGGSAAASGAVVNQDSAMRVAAVYACVRIIAGAVSSMPLKVYRREGRKQVEAMNNPFYRLITKRPNEWQTSKSWRKHQQSCILLNGNGYSLIAGTRRRPLALYPLDPLRMKPEQGDDLRIRYKYTRKNGGFEVFDQDEILHLRGMSLDGINGLSQIEYAREAIGLSLQAELHGAKQHKNGMRIGSAIEFPGPMSDQAYERLKAGIEQYQGAENSHKNLILEEGAKFSPVMSNVDAQWLESRKFQRGDIFMFFGVPPHMAGDTDKATSWGTGLEQQSQGFVSYTLDDHLTEWETALDALLGEDGTYCKFTRSALVRGDIRTRYAAYSTGLTNGFLTPNECREMEELDPMEGGDTLRVPLNTAPIQPTNKGEGNDPAETA